MTEKKKAAPAPSLKQAAATQRMSKDELKDLLKKAEVEDAAAAAEAAGDDDQPAIPKSK